jgi:hypothetical protein
MASPMKRTIETAILGFAPSLSKPDVSFILVPQAQEISAFPCDVGHEREDLEARIEDALAEAGLDKDRVDFSILEPKWTEKVRFVTGQVLLYLLIISQEWAVRSEP